MAMVYVAHKYGGDLANVEKAKKITHELQIRHPEHCFVCPLLTFAHLGYGELGFDEEMDLCFDLLTVCDVMVVASDVSEGIRRELDLARRIRMRVVDIAPRYRTI